MICHSDRAEAFLVRERESLARGRHKIGPEPVELIYPMLCLYVCVLALLQLVMLLGQTRPPNARRNPEERDEGREAQRMEPRERRLCSCGAHITLGQRSAALALFVRAVLFSIFADLLLPIC